MLCGFVRAERAAAVVQVRHKLGHNAGDSESSACSCKHAHREVQQYGEDVSTCADQPCQCSARGSPACCYHRVWLGCSAGLRLSQSGQQDSTERR